MLHYAFRRTLDDNGSHLITAPAFPEVTTFDEGDHWAAAVAPLTAAIEEAIAARIARNEDIPPSDERTDQVVKLPALTSLKTELYMALRRSGLTRAELARRLGWHREQVDRLFRLDHASRLEQLERVAKELGHDVSFELLTAA